MKYNTIFMESHIITKISAYFIVKIKNQDIKYSIKNLKNITGKNSWEKYTSMAAVYSFFHDHNSH